MINGAQPACYSIHIVNMSRVESLRQTQEMHNLIFTADFLIYPPKHSLKHITGWNEHSKPSKPVKAPTVYL